MKIAVVGATGYAGSTIVRELVDRGYEVVASARNTDKVFRVQNVAAVSTDVSAVNFADRLTGFDAVVSTFNPDWNNPNISADFIRGANSIIETAKATQVPYLLIVDGAGSLYVALDLQVVDTPDFSKAIYDGTNAARHLLATLLPRRDVSWSFVSPPARPSANGSFNEGKAGKYRLDKDDLLMDGEVPAGISVADLTVAIVSDAEHKAYLLERFTAAAA